MMSENNTNINTAQKSQSTSGQVKEKLLQFAKQCSFYTVNDYVREVIEIDYFDKADRPFAETIANIITEVLILPDDASVRISGYNLSAKTVALIFLDIRYEHVAGVMQRFREANYKIKHIKTYLRTALYNSFFEFEAREENLVNSC
ncbi:MAG: hypothetical protein J6B80_05920 [Clostridia bacterium]|nr:hypothetical protein [Clostridia bacterium]